MNPELETLVTLKYRPLRYTREYVEELPRELVEFIVDEVFQHYRYKSFFPPYPNNVDLLTDALRAARLVYGALDSEMRATFENEFFDAITRYENCNEY